MNLKSTSDQVKIGVVSGVLSSTESQSEESERFHFLLIPLDSNTYDPVKTRLLKSQAKAQEPTNHIISGFILWLLLMTLRISSFHWIISISHKWNQEKMEPF